MKKAGIFVIPKISVIVPTYNAETTIENCIKSILAQSFLDFELIIIDDGSTDTTRFICNTYEGKDKRVIVIHKENGGVSSARNLGLDVAQGDFVVFIDSDDTVEPFHLESLYQDGQYDFVTGGYTTQGPDGIWSDLLFCEDSTTRETVAAHPSKYMGKYYFGVTCAKLYKKEIIDTYNLRFPLDVHNGEDSLFIFCFLSHITRIKIIPSCGYNYFFYQSSLAHRIHTDNFKWRIQVEKQVMEFFQPTNINEVRWLEDRCFDVLMNLVKNHFPTMNHNEIYMLYADELFRRCVLYKKKYGSAMQRLFIISMELRCYSIYACFAKSGKLFLRIKNKLRRTLHILGKV